MILKSPYSPKKVVEILKEQIDECPSLLCSIIPFNVRYLKHNSDVCGFVKGSKFVLRNRISPSYSLIANGKISRDGRGSRIDIDYSKSGFSNIIANRLFTIVYWNRFKYDREIIEMFLNEWLKTKENDFKKYLTYINHKRQLSRRIKPFE